MKKWLIRVFRPCNVHTIQDPVYALKDGEVEVGREYTCKRCGYVQTVYRGLEFLSKAVVIGPGS